MEIRRVLDAEPVQTLADHVAAGGGRGLDAARAVEAEVLIGTVEASGLRGRGGAGFPTGTKWRTVADLSAASSPGMVVVNAAEGEPGSFKDRAILRVNPYRVLEGALIAARAIGSDTVVIATKASFRTEIDRVRAAIEEGRAAGWLEGIDASVVEGPEAYLFGEETAMLEVIDGRPPFPRLAPPFRHGVEIVTEAGDEAPPPTLVDNVETLANIPGIIAEGPEWFRSVGTEASPGTIVCTVTGSPRRHGVAEFAMGTPVREVIEHITGRPTTALRALLSGVAHPILPATQFDAPASYEGMEAAGSGLGAAGFIVFDDDVDLAAVAHGVVRFLGVESCGQCTPCKQDGLAIAERLDAIRLSDADDADLDEIVKRVATVTDGARCFLAHQTERVVNSVLQLMPEVLAAHLDGGAPAAEPYLIAPIVDLAGDRATLDESQLRKQPDWTFDEVDSGTAPADFADRDVEADGEGEGEGE